MLLSRQSFASIFSVFLLVAGVSASDKQQPRQEETPVTTIVNTVTITTTSSFYAEYGACKPTSCSAEHQEDLPPEYKPVMAVEIDTSIPPSPPLQSSSTVEIEPIMLSSEPKPTVSYTTISIAPSVSITGVHMEAVESPSSCYEPPVPTDALLKVAVSEEAQDPTLVFMSHDGTTPYYMGSWVDESFFFVDGSATASSEGRLALVQPNSYSILFHPNGTTISGSTCNWQVEITVLDFWGQLMALTASLPPQRRDGENAGAEGAGESFAATIRHPHKTSDTQPGLTIAGSPCELSAGPSDSTPDSWSFTCPFPGPNSPAGTCAANFTSWLGREDTATSPFPGRAKLIRYLSLLSPFLALVQDHILPHIPTSMDPPLSLAAEWLRQSPHKATSLSTYPDAVCGYVHQNNTQSLVFSDDGVSWPVLAHDGPEAPGPIDWTVPGGAKKRGEESARDIYQKISLKNLVTRLLPFDLTGDGYNSESRISLREKVAWLMPSR